jgi:hypothetical protein
MEEMKALRNKKQNDKKRKLVPKYQNRGFAGRLREAMEIRAEYIANYYEMTGILLNW